MPLLSLHHIKLSKTLFILNCVTYKTKKEFELVQYTCKGDYFKEPWVQVRDPTIVNVIFFSSILTHLILIS